MQWLIVYTGIFFLTSSAQGGAVCSVPDEQKALVSALLLDLANSVQPCVDPDPSVLLALNLGKNLNNEARESLLKQLKEEAVKKVSQDLPFTSGKVALYVLALRSSCCDPKNLNSPKGSINLVNVLEEKTEEELMSIEKTNSPLTTFYQVALDVLALCVVNSPETYKAGVTLANNIGQKPFVDTASVAVMGLACVLHMDSVPPKTVKTIKQTLSELIDLILGAQKSDGTIGNIYSTGLAGQALTAAQGYYPSESWKCTNTLSSILQQIPKGTFSMPGPAAQALPFLQGQSYLNVKGKECPTDNTPLITVEFTILNDLTMENFKHSIEVSVPEGSTLLQVMYKAAEVNSKDFSFSIKESSFGAYVTAINNLYESTAMKTYWQFFNGAVPLDKGVGTYIPKDKEHVLAIFSKY
ncbi:cobalamin binding intrinsic factor-like [Discoglossus pictus]